MMQKTTLFLVWISLVYIPFSSFAQCTEPDIPTVQFSDSVICQGGGSFLAIDSGNLNDASEWVWRRDSCNGTIVDTGSAIFVFPVQTTTYFVKGEGGCAQQSVCTSITVEVLSPPNPTIFGNDTICVGQTAELYIHSGPYNLLWSDNSTDTLFSANPTTTSAYYLIITDTSTQCSNLIDFEIYVHELSSVSIFGNPTICSGSFDTLYTAGFVSYQWSTGSTDSMIIVSPTNTTTYSVLATDSNACSSFATFEIGVIPNPIMLITGDAVVCNGEGSNLNASSIDQYLWSTGEISPSITVFPTTTTTYYVTGTDANGCFSVASYSVNVLALPIGTSSADANICLNDTVMLYAEGGDVYQWNTSQDTQFIEVSPIVSTIYWVIITDTFTQCSVTDTILISIHPSSPVSIIGDTIHCQNIDVILFAQGGVSYQWSTGEVSDSIIVSATYENPIYVTSIDSNSCVSSDTITLAFLPAPTIAFTGDFELCIGDTAHITASGAQYYLWYNNDFGATLSQVILEDQFVSVEAFNPGNGCTTIDSVFINVSPLPVIQFGGDTVLCLGESTIISASGALNYTWSTGSTNDTTHISPGNTIIISVQATDTNACMQTDSVHLVVNPIPTPQINLLQDTFCVQDPNLSLSAIPSGGDFSGTGIFGSTFIPAVAGPGFHTVLYEYTNGYGCYGQDTAVILVQSCVGIEETLLKNQVHVFPNPGTNDLWIDLTDESQIEMDIFNAIGARIMQQRVYKGLNHIDISTFEAGVYFIHLKKDQQVRTIPYLITK